MKSKHLFYFVTLGMFFISGCVANLQTYDLNDEFATSMHYKGTDFETEAEGEGEKSDLVGIPAISYYGGDLKRGAIWWAGKDMFLEKGEVFIIDATNVGPDTIPFGATFPPLDLVKDKIGLKLIIRAESNDSTMVPPVLYLQVDDADGYLANAKRPSNRIEFTEEFQEYYFDMKDIYMQSLPKKHSVNGSMINSLKFFINPGQKGFTGLLYIKEIKLIPAPAVDTK